MTCTEKSQLYQKIADYLLQAEKERREIPRITLEYPDLTLEEAYLIQQELVKRKLEEGKRILGPKMGLTSHAKMRQMNVDNPIYGYIFDYMVIPNGGVLKMDELIHPKVEAEIAFLIARDIEGPGVTGAQVLAATEYVIPALEVIDSRYQNFQFTLVDVVADNASSARVVFSDRLLEPHLFDLDLVGVTLTINGEVKAFGAGANVLGHPAHAVAMLANMLAERGEKIRAGEIILTGGITEALLINRGDEIRVTISGLGEVGMTVV